MRFSTGLVASLSVVGLVAALPEPQAPGSEKFECHSKCGGIISASRKPDFASNCAIYAADYAYCLDCAGPEKQNIWSMYGNSVSSAGEKCDWPTTPGAEMPTEGEEEEETPAPAPTESGNSTNGGVEPTQPEADSAAGVKVVSTGLIAAGLAAAAFFL
ncbi:hypothetical protein BJ508DRAFT_37812 [Ascobolus immersus RN42]|uniref:Uncharacterized protein n=1 Tax=Ascobolus immersus RN42 TaxID=1160509 RepID=A0A3N4IS10_ASCIM|nr:hypothetical protein BJ508DRAFT_37812 [Ascobolus immersus RN42]